MDQMVQDKQDKRETRERILLAAKREFAEKGFSGARMGSIAKRASANQALIHYYFLNKETLYIETMKYLTGVERHSFVDEIFKREELDIPGRLYVYLYLMVNIHLEAVDPDLMRILAREVAEDRSEFRTILFPYMMRRIGVLEEIIRTGVKEGCFETDNPLFVAMGAVMMILDYGSGRQNLKDTPWFDRLYSGRREKEFSRFIITHMFKSLALPGKGPVVPEISGTLRRELDSIITRTREQQKWHREDPEK